MVPLQPGPTRPAPVITGLLEADPSAVGVGNPLGILWPYRLCFRTCLCTSPKVAMVGYSYSFGDALAKDLQKLYSWWD